MLYHPPTKNIRGCISPGMYALGRGGSSIKPSSANKLKSFSTQIFPCPYHSGERRCPCERLNWGRGGLVSERNSGLLGALMSSWFD